MPRAVSDDHLAKLHTAILEESPESVYVALVLLQQGMDSVYGRPLCFLRRLSINRYGKRRCGRREVFVAALFDRDLHVEGERYFSSH